MRITLATLMMVSQIGGTSPIVAQAVSLNEYSVKAAFLFHFAQFVEWPDEAFSKADSPLVYCTIGEDPFHGVLDTSLGGKVAAGRAIQVRHAKRAPETQGCNVVFIGATENRQISAALAALQGSPILTVGESEQFVQEGGMIGFCVEENKIRFDINLGATEKANLKISAKLLMLAKRIIGGPKRD